MESASAESFRDVAATTFQAVGPARIAVLTLLAIRDDDLALPRRRKTVDMAVTRIDVAHATLTARFPETLTRVGFLEPPEVKDSRIAAAEVLTPIFNALADGAKPTRDVLGDTEAFRALCIDEVDPKVTRFLDIMMDALGSAQSEQDRRVRAETVKAVRSATSVGRSIQVISVNAAIEASRSGIHGRGFKVIAEEIRTLADRTQAILGDVARRLTE
ncbi:MAG: methyl-accepting chemotaxis protein [Pseudomonadota bacterium]